MPDWRIGWYRGGWAVVWNDGDVRRRYALGTADRAEAARRAPARYAQLTRPRGTTVADLWKGYCDEKAGLPVVGTMKYTWRALAPRFGSMEAAGISKIDCDEHTKERRAAGVADGTIHTELGHLRSVLLWAEKGGLIDRAPHVERPRKPPPRDVWLNRDEVERLLAHATAPHVRLAVLLMITTGTRIGAALELTWDRVDLERRLVDLANPFDRTRRKKRAIVPINDTLFAALGEARRSSVSGSVIEYAGRPVKSIKRGLKQTARNAGVDPGRVSPHVLRHSAAVWLAEAGTSMSEIAQYLGHSDSRITERVYARYSPAYLRKVAARLEI